jgi:hypothetical protein
MDQVVESQAPSSSLSTERKKGRRKEGGKKGRRKAGRKEKEGKKEQTRFDDGGRDWSDAAELSAKEYSELTAPTRS